MAARYWVGGSGTWQAGDTSHWSATSGGAAGASVPTAADTVTINAASGGGTITVSGDMPCLSFTTAGFTGSIAGGLSGSYISHYNGSCTIAVGNTDFTCGIRNRATGTTAYTLTISCTSTTINTYEKLGAGTAIYTVSHTSTGTCTIGNINHTTTTGTLTITNSNATSFGQLNIGLYGSVINLTGNTIFNGGTIYATTFTSGLTINLNAGGTIAFNQNIYFSGGSVINLYKTLTVNTSTGTYACNFAPGLTVNLYTGASWTTDGQNTSVSVDCDVNIYAGLFRIYHATAAVITNARVTLSGGTFQFGASSANQTYIRSLAVTGTGAKTLAYNSTTLNYLAVNGGALTLSGTNTTFPAAAWFLLHYNTTNASTSRLTLENNVTASFLRLTCNSPYGSYLMLGSGYSLGVYSLTVGSAGTAVGVQLASISASVAGTGAATDSDRYFLYGYQGVVPTLGSTVMAIFSYTDFYNITSAISVTPTRAGDCGGNTNITFSAPVTRYWVGAGGTSNWDSVSWSASSGGAVGASIPLAQDTVYIDAGSTANLVIQTRVPSKIYNTNAAITISASVSILGKTILFKDFETVGSVTGNLGLGPTGTTTNLKLAATSGTQISIDGANLSGVGIGTDGSRVWALSGNVNCGVSNVNARFYITTPITLDTNNYGITCAGFYVQTTGCSGNFGTSTIAANDVGFNNAGFNVSSVTWTPNTSTVASSSNIASFVSVVDIYKYLVTATSTIGTISINSASGRTIGELASERTADSWILATQYSGIKLNKWSISGTTAVTRVIVVASFEYTGTGVVSADYLNIQGSVVTPSTNTWYAGTHSLDGGGNSGWIFTAPPSGNSLFFGSNF